jgi:hypothetical protein
MKLAELFPSKWLKAADLEGRQQLVTIEQIKLEAIEDGEPPKPVIKLRGLTQGLVLNKTNAGSIATFLGDDLDRWPGQKIVLFPDKASFQGKMVDCIRVRQPKAPVVGPVASPVQPVKATEAPAQVVDSDDVPF